jgi:DNA mismatch repair protein MutS
MGETANAFTLFATHYFELTALADELPACSNVHLDATEHDEQLVFLHSVKPGPANQSYGLQVAALAGVPRKVIRRAKAYLMTLEAMQVRQHDSPQGQLPLTVADPDVDDALRRAVDDLDPDSMSPREALEALYRLRDI